MQQPNYTITSGAAFVRDIVAAGPPGLLLDADGIPVNRPYREPPWQHPLKHVPNAEYAAITAALQRLLRAKGCDEETVSGFMDGITQCCASHYYASISKHCVAAAAIDYLLHGARHQPGSVALFGKLPLPETVDSLDSSVLADIIRYESRHDLIFNAAEAARDIRCKNQRIANLLKWWLKGGCAPTIPGDTIYYQENTHPPLETKIKLNGKLTADIFSNVTFGFIHNEGASPSDTFRANEYGHSVNLGRRWLRPAPASLDAIERLRATLTDTTAGAAALGSTAIGMNDAAIRREALALLQRTDALLREHQERSATLLSECATLGENEPETLHTQAQSNLLPS